MGQCILCTKQTEENRTLCLSPRVITNNEASEEVVYDLLPLKNSYIASELETHIKKTVVACNQNEATLNRSKDSSYNLLRTDIRDGSNASTITTTPFEKKSVKVNFIYHGFNIGLTHSVSNKGINTLIQSLESHTKINENCNLITKFSNSISTVDQSENNEIFFLLYDYLIKESFDFLEYNIIEGFYSNSISINQKKKHFFLIGINFNSTDNIRDVNIDYIESIFLKEYNIRSFVFPRDPFLALIEQFLHCLI